MHGPNTLSNTRYLTSTLAAPRSTEKHRTNVIQYRTLHCTEPHRTAQHHIKCQIPQAPDVKWPGFTKTELFLFCPYTPRPPLPPCPSSSICPFVFVCSSLGSRQSMQMIPHRTSATTDVRSDLRPTNGPAPHRRTHRRIHRPMYW